MSRPSASPEGSEAPKLPEASGVDLARVALRAAKEQARARGAAAQQKKQARRGGGLRSGARADGRDPLPLGAAINRLITERGWETPAAVGGVMGRWPQIVGEDVAKHCVPQRTTTEDERVLTVQCDSTAWATQLRLLAPRLVARLNEDLGHGTVRLIKVLGPAGHRSGSAGCGRPAARGPATRTDEGTRLPLMRPFGARLGAPSPHGRVRPVTQPGARARAPPRPPPGLVEAILQAASTKTTDDEANRFPPAPRIAARPRIRARDRGAATSSGTRAAPAPSRRLTGNAVTWGDTWE